MTGYWEKAIERVMARSVAEYDEDWSEGTVSFDIGSPSAMEIPFTLIYSLSSLLGTNDLVIKVESDNRYPDSGYATVTFTFKKVKFPTRPD